MSHKLAFTLGAVLTGLAASSALAAPNCGCTIRPETEQISRNEVVIKGKVTEIKYSKRLGKKVVLARINVLQAIKGTKRRYVTVEAPDKQGECAVPFKMDEPIQLAARPRGTRYRTNVCKVFPVKD